MSVTQFPTQTWEVLAEAAKAHAIQQDRAEAFSISNTEPLDKELVFGPAFHIENTLRDPVLIQLARTINHLKKSEARAESFQIMVGRNTYVTVKVTGPIEVRKSGPSLIEVISKDI